MKRKIYDQLLKWKKNNGQTALLIEGARRVGKSYIAQELAKNEYKSYILLDFSIVSDSIKELFMNYINDLDSFFLYLSTLTSVKLYERESLIIFDEVQFFPKARQAIKHLVADGRYDYLETGSLISIKENVQDILIPSEEEKVKMFPMDFEEFCLATNNEGIYAEIERCFLDMKPMGVLHKKAMDLFRLYMIVGGMPKVVSTYIETRDFDQVDRQKRLILSLYKDDINKSKYHRLYIKSIFDEIPAQLSKQEKKFTFAASGGKYRDLIEPFEWLKDSMMVNVCYKTTEPNIGLKINMDKVTLKCFMGDTGLLISHAFDEKGIVTNDIYQKLLTNKLEVNKGMLMENIVSQMLVSGGNRLYYYQSSSIHAQDRMEIDFLIAKDKISNRHNISPIEVKSGKYNAFTSIDKFTHKYKQYIDQVYILTKDDLHITNDKIFLPLYMAGLL